MNWTKTVLRNWMTAVLLMVTAMAAAQGQQIGFDDMMKGAYRARGVREVHPLSDGESFARVSQDGRKVERCSFRTGEVVETLFDADAARGAVVRYVEGYQMSPDGRNMLIATDVQPIYRHSATATYYIYNLKNRTLEPLSKGGAQECPKFSPDGTMIAFVRDNDLYVVKLLFGNAETRVTTDGERNRIINGKPDWVYEEEFTFDCAFDFSADSEMLAWIRFDESRVRTYDFPWYRGSNPDRDEFRLYPGRYEYKYPKAGEENARVEVRTYDIKSRVTRTMQVPLDQDGYIPRIQFTGDRDRLMVLTLNRHQDRLDFYAVNPRSTTAQLILRETDKRYVDQNVYEDLDFTHDHFVLPSERDGHRHLYLYTAQGQLVRQLTQGDSEVTEYYGTSPDGRQFYYASTEGNPTEQRICRIDQNGKKTPLTPNAGYSEAIFSQGCRYFLHTWSDLHTPPVYTLRDANGKALKTLEDNADLRNRLAALQLGQAELFQLTTADGIQLNGWMVKPADFNPQKRYPVLMYQYSGPGSQQVLNAFSSGFMSGLIWEHRLAQRGCIVVCVDGRGTGGRGSDFKRCTYLKMGDLESHDQVETALWLARQSYVDPDRIAIWGWSFGGFNTLMSMSEGRPVFRCGIAVAPVTDWRFYDTVYTERFMRTPQENPEGYDCSPLHRYEHLHGNLLLIHGMADDNVHFQNTAELAEALVQAGIQFDQQIYTNRNHSIYGGNTRRHLLTRIENYLDEKLLK